MANAASASTIQTTGDSALSAASNIKNTSNKAFSSTMASTYNTITTGDTAVNINIQKGDNISERQLVDMIDNRMAIKNKRDKKYAYSLTG